MTRAKERDLVVIGASAGGLGVIEKVISSLGTGLRATICVAIHRGPSGSELVTMLGQRSSLPVCEPSHGERIEHDTVYLAPADRHLRINGDRFAIDRGPKEHHTRPAIDPLFTSAASAFGERVIGILLSGNLSDGVAGLIAIKKMAGLSLVQDPTEAQWPSMPHNALLYDHVDLVFVADVLPLILTKLVRGASPSEAISGLTHTEARRRAPVPAAPRRRS